MNLISQSEVDMYLSCEKKHWYAFGEPCEDGSRGVSPTSHSDSLSRGTIGHAFLDDLYQGVMDGLTWDNSAMLAKRNHFQRLVEEPELAGLYNQISGLMEQYIEHYANDPEDWEPLAIEYEFRYAIPNTDLIFPFKPDVVIRNKHTDKVYVWDHKFLFNTYPQKTISIMPQLAKYSEALNKLGYEVDGALYNQISTRPNSKAPFSRVLASTSEAKRTQFFTEQVSAMHRIASLKSLPSDVWRDSALRTASSFNCQNCQFLDLCTMDLTKANGRSIHLREFFEPNKYGYGKGENNDVQ